VLPKNVIAAEFLPGADKPLPYGSYIGPYFESEVDVYTILSVSFKKVLDFA
jgi:hypothetical protein